MAAFKAYIPNALTMGNLVCGSMAVVLLADRTVDGWGYLPGLLFLAAFFDLLDGAIARALGVSGEMGKQLDSLADVVSFGLVPSLLIYRFLEEALPSDYAAWRWLALVNVCAAAYRLARFNISTDQTKDFRGMPSPAHGLFWAAVALSIVEKDWPMVWPWYVWASVLVALSLLTAWLMISNLRMFSFKLKPGGWKANPIPYLYIASLPVIALLGWLILPGLLTTLVVAMLWYMALSVVYHWRAQEPQ
jgi:CDP-diacylglycerol--serine O-phosphatidyltransferase